MKKKKGFLKRGGGSEEMSLQITSMADIFMILLVFLLKGYSTGAVSITPTPGLILPQAQASEAAVEALKVEIAQDAVLIEGKPAAKLANFEIQASDRQSNGTLKSLTTQFEKERKRQLLIAKNNSDVKVDPKVMIIADQRAPYSTLKAVLASAAVHGYTDFKLAVAKGE
jgi:biopolymer transport protein ExbD